MAVAKRNTSGGMNRLRLFITALVAAVLIAPFMGTGQASALDMRNPNDAVKSYQYYYAVAKCIMPNYSVTSVGNGTIGEGGAGGDPVGVGHLIDAADGQQECQNIMPAAISFWGYSGIGAALTDWGFKVEGSFWHNDTPGTGFASKIREKFYGGSNPSLSASQLYALYYNAFFVGCKVSGGIEYAKADSGVQASANSGSGDYIRVKITDVFVDPPVVKDMIYKLGTDRTSIITAYAGGGSIPGDGGNDGKMQCQTLAQQLSSYADEYATWAKSNPALAQSATASSTTGGTAAPDPCPINEESSLRWLICPLVLIGDNTIGKLDTVIQNFLVTPVDQMFKGVDGASKNFRNIGLALVVIAGLFMIVSTALGFEFFDAYTIKKVLPRLAVAAIGIALAGPLLKVMIIATNDFGLLIDKIVVASVNIPDSGSFSGFGTKAVAGVGGSAILVTAGVALGAMGLLSLIGTVLLALLIGLLVLAIRQMVIMVCVLLAPVAIAAYILPGTQKFWEFWKNSLITSLLMFPIIMAFIASGKALSILLASGTPTPMMEMLSLIVRYAPYFLLPFAFKLAGGLMSTIFSIANDRGKGGFDRLKKYRGAKAAENFGKMKAGNRFSDRNAFTRKFNRGTAGIGSGMQGHFGVGERGRQAIDQARRNAGEGFKKSAGFMANQENDDALHAWTYNSAAEAKAGLTARWGSTPEGQARVSRAIAAAQAGGGFGRVQAITAAQQLATTGTGYDSMDDQVETLARAAGGDQNTAAAMAGYNNFINKQKGRHDLAPGAGALIGAVTDRMDQLKGSTGQPGAAGPRGVGSKITENAWNSGSLYQIANGKGKGTKNLTSYWESEYTAGINELRTTGNADRLQKATIAMKEMHAMLPNASGDNQLILNEAIERMEAARAAALTSMPGYLPPGTPGAKTRQQDTFDNMEALAEKRARTYQRPDEATR